MLSADIWFQILVPVSKKWYRSVGLYTLNQSTFCSKQFGGCNLSKIQRKFTMVSKAVYGLYVKPCMVWFLVFRIYDQTLSWQSLPPIFLIYTSLQLKMHYRMLLFGRPIMFYLSLPPILILLVRALKSIPLLLTLHQL